MGLFFIYILKASVCLALFYLFYKVLLSKETFHRIAEQGNVSSVQPAGIAGHIGLVVPPACGKDCHQRTYGIEPDRVGLGKPADAG